MYGVIVCSRCKRAKGVSLSQKTTVCQCGNKITLHGSKVKSKTADARELVRLVAGENARLRGGIKIYEGASGPPKKLKGVLGLVADEACKARRKEDRPKVVATELTNRLGTFTARDFILVASSLGIARPRNRLWELLDLNFVYEPEPDHYKAV